MYCGQTVGWIKMKLGMQVGLSPVHIVLDGDQVTPPQRGRAPPILGPYLLLPNDCMDQYATWYGAPNFWSMLIVAKRLDRSSCHLVGMWALVQAALCKVGTQVPSPKGAQPSNFRLVSVVAKWLEGLRCHLVLSPHLGLGPGRPCEKGHSPPFNFWPMFVVAKRLDG